MTEREREEVKALFAAWVSAAASCIFERSTSFDEDFRALHADASSRGEVLGVDVDGLFRRYGFDCYLYEEAV